MTKEVKKTVLRTVETHNLIDKDMHIVLGLSGGADSLCLFHLLDDLSKGENFNLKIYPVHINHQLRPVDADKDQAFVEMTCREMGYRCESFIFDCNKIAKDEGLTSEEAGRKVRYEAFRAVANTIEKSGISKERIVIAVAQNANDQAETILFRILRGTGIDGLSGIHFWRYDEAGYRVIRPLLEVSREDIEAYCEKHGLKPCVDKTNAEPFYTRNKIRLNLLPNLAENFNPNIYETLIRLGESAALDRSFLEEETEKLFNKIKIEEDSRVYDGVFNKVLEIHIKPLEKVHQALIFRVYNRALREIGLYENVTLSHIKEIEKLRLSEKPSAEISLVSGYGAFRSYGKLVFFRREKAVSLEERKAQWKMRRLGRADFEAYKKEAVEKEIVYGAFSLREIEDVNRLEIRSREKGDLISLKGGRKKLQDLFVDMKVPKKLREDCLVLALGNRVLWVLPSEIFTNSQNRLKGRFSIDFKVDEEKENDILVLERV